MPTDDERREIAERLRNANENSCSPDCELRYALDGSYDCVGNGCTGCHLDAFERLADLIEPDECQFRDAAKTVDRGALLALADEIHGLVENREIRFFHTVQVHESTLATIETRIRSALGVDDND